MTKGKCQVTSRDRDDGSSYSDIPPTNVEAADPSARFCVPGDKFQVAQVTIDKEKRTSDK